MTRRRVLLLGSVAVVVALAVAVWMVWPRPGVTWANAAKIREGMTRSEVEAILGGTPEQHPPPKDDPNITGFRPIGTFDVIVGEQWFGREVVVIVRFDDAGKVERAQTCELVGPVPDNTFLRRVRLWLGL
jgi:hypothetical protein